MTKKPLKVGQPSLDRVGKIFASHPVRPMNDLLNFGRSGCLELWLRIHGRTFCVNCAFLVDRQIWANAAGVTGGARRSTRKAIGGAVKLTRTSLSIPPHVGPYAEQS